MVSSVNPTDIVILRVLSCGSFQYCLSCDLSSCIAKFDQFCRQTTLTPIERSHLMDDLVAVQLFSDRWSLARILYPLDNSEVRALLIHERVEEAVMLQQCMKIPMAYNFDEDSFYGRLAGLRLCSTKAHWKLEQLTRNKIVRAVAYAGSHLDCQSLSLLSLYDTSEWSSERPFGTCINMILLQLGLARVEAAHLIKECLPWEYDLLHDSEQEDEEKDQQGALSTLPINPRSKVSAWLSRQKKPDRYLGGGPSGRRSKKRFTGRNKRPIHSYQIIN